MNTDKYLRKIFQIVFLAISLFAIFIGRVEANAQTESLEGQVINIIEKIDNNEDGEADVQKLEVKLLSGDKEGDTVEVKNSLTNEVGGIEYEMGDRVQLELNENDETGRNYYIVGYVRKIPILVLSLIFVILAILVGQIKGLTALISLGMTFVVIFTYTLPNMYAGKSPVIISIITILFIIPITFYVAHGFNKKTSISVVGALIAISLTVMFAQVAVNATRLTGFGTDEANILNVLSRKDFDMRGLLLAGMIISSVGVLDDVTISQAGVVEKLKEVNNKLKFKELFTQSMEIGHDHIASMINTLVLVYAGASLPLLLIFVESPKSLGNVINMPFIAEEIVRMIVGSVSLILAVPVTSLIASLVYEDEIVNSNLLQRNKK
jgi:uncharacterized membrane protein